MTALKPKLKIGEVAVCRSCLRTTFERAEAASGRCRCGGAIIAMPKGEVEARRTDKGSAGPSARGATPTPKIPGGRLGTGRPRA